MTWLVICCVLTAMLATSLGLIAGGRLASGKVADAEARIAVLEAALARQAKHSARASSDRAEMGARSVADRSPDTVAIAAALRALSDRPGRDRQAGDPGWGSIDA